MLFDPDEEDGAILSSLYFGVRVLIYSQKITTEEQCYYCRTTIVDCKEVGLEPAVPKSQEKPKAKPVQVSQTKKSQQSADSKLTENSKPDTKQQVPEIATVQPPTPTQQVNSSTAVTSNNLLDTTSVNSKISAITEESETGADFYEQLMAKYGIELSDDSDDDY